MEFNRIYKIRIAISYSFFGAFWGQAFFGNLLSLWGHTLKTVSTNKLYKKGNNKKKWCGRYMKRKVYEELNRKLDDLNYAMTKSKFLDLVELLGNRKELFWRNIWSGMIKGIGIGIGVTIITAIILIILQKIVTWNIPVIGEYIADIVEIVENNR